MKNFEKKILKRIYLWETRKTIIEIILKATLFFSSFLFLIIFLQVFFEILNEQKSFDLLNFFGEDFVVIKRYFLDNIVIFWFEMPKLLLLLILVFFISTSLILLILIKNFNIFKNKVKSLIKYFKKYEK